MPNYLLTIEIEEKAQRVVIHGDPDGLRYLAKSLEGIAASADNLTTHHHLMTEDWGGTELTSQKQSLDNGVSLVNHLAIYGWKK